MTDLETIDASFSVSGGHAQKVTLDVWGMTPDAIADLVLETAEGISLCHQCGREISDPELNEVTGFSLRGVEYTQRSGMWVPVS